MDVWSGCDLKRCGCRDAHRRRLGLDRRPARRVPRQRQRRPAVRLWWLAGLRGLRRGELYGLRWSDIDLDRGVLTIERNRTTARLPDRRGRPEDPGRAAGGRPGQTQRAEPAGAPSVRAGPAGRGGRERETVDRVRLRVHPIRRAADQPELRHHPVPDPRAPRRSAPGPAARPAPRRRVPRPRGRRQPEILQDLLGHSSIVVTADTYTSVLPQIQRRCADAAQLVLNAARRTRKKIKTKARKNRPDRGPKTSAPSPAKPKQVLRPRPNGSRPRSRRSRRD